MMGRSQAVSGRAQPQEGDVVVLPQSSSDQGWSLLRYPGPAQIAEESRELAITIAGSVAAELSVDVWSFEAGTYTILEIHRGHERTARRKRPARRV
jgi:hypothetical protein